jgi:hypothetical protein
VPAISGRVFFFSISVPSTATNAFIGTDSGLFRFNQQKPALSYSISLSPPLITFMISEHFLLFVSVFLPTCRNHFITVNASPAVTSVVGYGIQLARNVATLRFDVHFVSVCKPFCGWTRRRCDRDPPDFARKACAWLTVIRSFPTDVWYLAACGQ